MGLLDSLFSGGGGGGLLDFLRENAMNQQFGGGLQSDQAQYGAPIGAMAQMQPRPSMPSAPMMAQAAPPQQPAPQAQPMQAPQQPQQALPPALGGQPQGGAGFGDRLNAGAQNFANAGGLLPALVGGVSGMLTGQRNDPQGIAQQNLKAQFDALEPVLGRNKAMLAVMNPEAGKILLGQALEAKLPEYGVIDKDEFGKDIYGWKDAKSKTITPYSSQPTQSAGASTLAPRPAGVDPKIWRDKQSERAVQDVMPASFDDTSKMRTELSKLPSYQNISQAAPIYKSMHDAAGRNTKAADLNMVYGLGKIMDPGSVVREGEIHMANNAQGWQEKLNGVIAQINGQGGLTPEGRQMLMAEAQSRMMAYKQMYDQDAERFRGIAKRNKANPEDVVHDFGEFPSWTAPRAAAPVTIDGYTIKAR